MPYETFMGTGHPGCFLGRLAPLLGLEHLREQQKAPEELRSTNLGETLTARYYQISNYNINEKSPNTFCRLIVLCRSLQFISNLCFFSKRERVRGGLFGY